MNSCEELTKSYFSSKFNHNLSQIKGKCLLSDTVGKTVCMWCLHCRKRRKETIKPATLLINRFQRLIVCIIVPDNHCCPLWMINISKTVGKASARKPIFSALPDNYGRPSDVLQLIRIFAFKHMTLCRICLLAMF